MMIKKEKFKEVIEECFEVLKAYLVADKNQADETFAEFFQCELFERYSKKAEWKMKLFFTRYKREETPAEIKAQSNEYSLFVFSSLKKKYSDKSLSAISVGEISKDLYLSLRRVDEYLRKELNIASPPKPLVRLYHLRKFTLKIISSNPRAKAASDANISSFLKNLCDQNRPAAKFIFDNFNDEIGQKLLRIVGENSFNAVKNETLRQVCLELNRLIKEYDGERDEKKHIYHQAPFMFFDEFGEFVGEDEKIKYTVPLTNRYKNREILSRVFTEISPLESVQFAEITEATLTMENQFDKSKIEGIEKLFDLLIKLPRVTDLVKAFWERVEFCVSEFCQDNVEIYLFKFLVEKGKWTDKSMDDRAIKKCILAFCDNKETRFRRYKLNLRKAWKRVVEGKGKDLYDGIILTI